MTSLSDNFDFKAKGMPSFGIQDTFSRLAQVSEPSGGLSRVLGADLNVGGPAHNGGMA